MDCEEFYRLRDQRTAEYLPGEAVPDSAVHVAIDRETATTRAGQLTLLALANQLARVHRRITFALPEPRSPLYVPSPFGGETLEEALLQTVSAIDPCGAFSLGAPTTGVGVSIGIGPTLENGYDWYLGANRAIAFLSPTPVGFTTYPATMRGAALAACLGAAAGFRRVLGRPVVPRTLSAWNYAEGEAAEPGPENLEPVDVGHVLLVGAGAVGGALAYWMHEFGTRGLWTVVDGDKVELHNTNRGLPFTPAHAGWPSGNPSTKVEVLSSLLPGARVYPAWYDECEAIREERFDVILGLANDRGVRRLLASRNGVVTLQATTGSNWLSQMHRHIVGRDDCLWCRTGEIETPVFGCSTAEVSAPENTRSDAALPFLSAASGLMLAVALQRLQHGDFADDPCNDWRWDFDSSYRLASASVRRCRENCRCIDKPARRRRISEGQKWQYLDPACTR